MSHSIFDIRSKIPGCSAYSAHMPSQQTRPSGIYCKTDREIRLLAETTSDTSVKDALVYIVLMLQWCISAVTWRLATRSTNRELTSAN